MNPIPESLPAPSIRRTLDRLQPATAVAMALVVAFLLGAAVGASLRGVPTTDLAPRAIQLEVTDGWMSSIASIHAARRAAVTTDGWATRYLPSATAGRTTDGWATRYLPSAATDFVTDGWATRFLPSARER